MIQNRFHFNMALLMALLLHGGLIFGYRLPAEKVLPSPPPPLRLSLRAPLVETEVASKPAPFIPEPLPRKVSPSPPLEREVLPEPTPEPLPEPPSEPLPVVPPPPPLPSEPEPPALVAEIPVVPPEIEMIPEEVVPEVPTQELPIIPPEPLPESEVVEAVDLPEPPPEVEPEPILPEPVLEAVSLPQTVLAEAPIRLEPETVPPDIMPEPVLEIPTAPMAPEPAPVPPAPEAAVSDVSKNRVAPQENAEAAAAYKKLLAAWLEKHKYYPRRARRLRIEGEGWLRIRIDHAGRAQDIRLERTTGNRLLDQAALDIARRADPFPALPKNNAGRELEFIVPISFVMR